MFGVATPHFGAHGGVAVAPEVCQITGNLKEMVLKRVGIDTSFGALGHTVEIIETHEDGGYCGSCAFEYLVFTILVDGEQVYNESFSDNPFGVLQDWLSEESDE